MRVHSRTRALRGMSSRVDCTQAPCKRMQAHLQLVIEEGDGGDHGRGLLQVEGGHIHGCFPCMIEQWLLGSATVHMGVSKGCTYKAAPSPRGAQSGSGFTSAPIRYAGVKMGGPVLVGKRARLLGSLPLAPAPLSRYLPLSHCLALIFKELGPQDSAPLFTSAPPP